MTVHRAAMRLRDRFYAHSDAQEKAMRLDIIDGGGYAALRSAAGTQPVAPENLELLERLARTLAGNLKHDVADVAHRILPVIHPSGPLQIGQSLTIKFERGPK